MREPGVTRRSRRAELTAWSPEFPTTQSDLVPERWLPDYLISPSLSAHLIEFENQSNRNPSFRLSLLLLSPVLPRRLAHHPLHAGQGSALLAEPINPHDLTAIVRTRSDRITYLALIK